MKPPLFAYYDPRSVAETVSLLARLENARLLAGGQSLMPMLNMRVALPDHLIDLNRVEGVSDIRAAGEMLHIGAMTRQRALEDSADVRARCPLLAEALTQVGHRQTRNRGTLGGSLCNLDPAAELVAVAAALDAVIEIGSTAGSRSVPMTDFVLDFMNPAISADEMVTQIRLPLWPPGHGYCFTEFARRHGDFAVVSAAVLLLPDDAGRIARASVTLGGLGAAPVRMREVETMLIGNPPSEALYREAAAQCSKVDAIEDIHVPTWYRQHLAGVLTRRALVTAQARAAGWSKQTPSVTGTLS